MKGLNEKFHNTQIETHTTAEWEDDICAHCYVYFILLKQFILPVALKSVK